MHHYLHIITLLIYIINIIYEIYMYMHTVYTACIVWVILIIVELDIFSINCFYPKKLIFNKKVKAMFQPISYIFSFNLKNDNTLYQLSQEG